MQLDHARITANISGEFEPFDNFSHDVKLEFSSQETGTGNLNAIGNSKVSNLDLNLRLHQATVSAEISEWLTNPNYSLTGRLDSENILGIPVAFSFNAKGNQQQGNVQLDGKISGQQVKLDKLMYLVRNNSYSLDVAGIVSGAPLKLNTDFTRSGIENSELSWAPVLSSKNVRVSSALTTASGPWQNLDIQLKADAEINNHPAKLQLNSILKELGSLSIKPSRLSFLDGQIEFHGSAETSPTTALQVQGKIAQVHLEKIDPRLPQLDSGDFILVWNSQTGNTQLSSSISDLRAKVSKKQLTGNAELKMHNNQISMANLFLQADPENHIDLNLLDTKQQLLGIKIHINQLGSFIHEARGSIKGQIKLGLADRSADGELEISELSIPELISLNQASIIADNSNNHQDLAITANQVRIRELDILKLDLGLIGTQEKHALDASLLLDNERSISLQGEGRRSRQNYHLFIQQ
ncbi:MAG: hypothetical protein KJO88_09845, partial [Gammaproteobacteria bacterium]|nr:hypothetical protein [Gammaproteobacteria bacterium]